MKCSVVLTFFVHLYLSKDKYIEISNLSRTKWDQVGQVGHGISTALLDNIEDKVASGLQIRVCN